MPKKLKSWQVTFIAVDARKRPVNLTVAAEKETNGENIRQTIAERTKVAKECLQLGIVKGNVLIRLCNSSDRLRLDRNTSLIAYETLQDADSKLPIALEISRKERSYLLFSGEVPFTFPRLIYIDPTCTLAGLHRFVFSQFSWWIPGLRSDTHPVSDQLLLDTFPNVQEKIGGDRQQNPYVLKTKGKIVIPFDEGAGIAQLRTGGDAAGLTIVQLWQEYSESVLSCCTPSLSSVSDKETSPKVVTLAECLIASCSPKTLDRENTWKCPKCCMKVQATKEMTIFRASKILLIHLKRFKQSHGYMKKDDHAIAIPKTLDICPYMKNSLSTGKTGYELYAVSSHSGGMGGGHYTAYSQVNKRWYLFNDSSVHLVDEAQVLHPSSTAYVLCYSRIG
jgi:hypothetical protein